MNKVIKYTLLFFLLFSYNNSFSQKNKKDSKNESNLYSGLKFRSVGPAFMSGRIAEIAINPENENEWYVAVGSGGVTMDHSEPELRATQEELEQRSTRKKLAEIQGSSLVPTE